MHLLLPPPPANRFASRKKTGTGGERGGFSVFPRPSQQDLARKKKFINSVCFMLYACRRRLFPERRPMSEASRVLTQESLHPVL